MALPIIQSCWQPPSTCVPLPPTFIQRRVMPVSPGEGWGGGQRQCGGEGHNGNNNDDNAAIAADRKDDKRVRR